MRLLRVAAAALNQTPLDWDHNLANMVQAIRIARQRGVSLLCLPELCVTGYGCEDAFYSAAVIKTAGRVLAELLPETKGMAACVGLPVLHSVALYNACAMLVDGRLVGLVAKQHLAGEGLHYEPRWFKPWPAGRVTQASVADMPCVIGDLLFDFQGVRVGFEICEDAWVADRPAEEQSRRGVDIILNPSASHFAFGKSAVRRQLVTGGSRTFGVTYVYSNLVGNEAGRIIYDGETLIATRGEIVAHGPRLEFSDVVVTDAVIDIDATRMRRAQSGGSHPLLEIDDHRVAHTGFLLPICEPEQRTDDTSSWEVGFYLQEEEFTRAIALALYDYLRKSRSKGFVISLSGGADSTTVACLGSIMIQLAVASRGWEGFCQSLGLSPDAFAQHDPIRAVTRALITTMYQATRNSSETTRMSAATVAQALGTNHIELDVDDLYAAYVGKVETALQRKLTWERDDMSLQNIQARVRGPSAWLIANLNNALLLSTSNRSEAAVGYATMDGDTCGGISPIAGIDKAFLLKWLRWLESTGPAGLGPIPAVSVVNRLSPTAELRPPASGQTDEGDLMPYDVLDAIEHHAIGERRSPSEVLAAVRVEFKSYTATELSVWVRRFFELWSRNQWKRERYAPSFHVDDKNLDPKTWCRFPILSGGFRRELAELSAHREPVQVRNGPQ